MEGKRRASDYLDNPPSKRRLLYEGDVPNNLVGDLDISEDQPSLHDPPPLLSCDPTREVFVKEFPIIKNGKKYFKIGVNINDFTPCVSLVSETTNKVIHLTMKEFDILLSEDNFNSVLRNYENKTVKPICFEDVLLSIKPYASSNNICISKNKSSIYFALSSWKFLQRIKLLMRGYLSSCQTQCFYSTSNFIPLLTHAKHFCAPIALDNVSEGELFSALSKAFDVENIFFPESLKQEILCYHLEFLRDKLLE